MPADLRAVLSGIRALLLDLDGVIVLKGELLPGAGEALAELEARAIPYRIVTNTSLVSRASLSRWGDRLGAPIPADRIMSALSASAAFTRHRYPGQPLFVIASTDALTEFEGQRLLSADEADAPDARAAAVVVGDAPEAITYDNLNRAFRLVRAGAELIGMHRNPWWLTPDGPTLDSGAMVTGLEFATERSARILGKPSADFFREAAMRSAPRSARGVARGFCDARSRWSATISGPTCSPPSGSGCTACSSCPASTGSMTSRRSRRVAAGGGRMASRRPSGRSLAR